MIKDNGGPAFPWCGDLNDCPTINLGMSLRDYFAAKAMTGLMSNEEAIQRFRNMSMSEGFEASTLMATAAYQIADAMLAERAK